MGNDFAYCSIRHPQVCSGGATGGLVADDGLPICRRCHEFLSRPKQSPPRRASGGAPKYLRKRVLARDGYQCQLRCGGICTERATQVDHVVNVAAILRSGGTHAVAHAISNLQAVCAECHAHKSERERREGCTIAGAKRGAARRQRLALRPEKHPGD